MIAKKNPRYNLEGKRIVIFSLGLLTTTAATLAAFTYQSPLQSDMEKAKVNSIPIDYLVEDAPEIKPIIIQQQQQNQNDQQSNDQSSNASQTSVDISQQIVTVDNRNNDPIITIGAPNVNVSGIGVGTVSNEIIDIPDKDALFIGGYTAMQEYIAKNINYPEIDVETGTQGVVYVNFVVEVDGSISNITVQRGLSKTIDREAKRIVAKFPKWIPGQVKAEAVRTRVMLPIRFTLE